MDRVQVVQHMALAISFIGLVITGFALRFPQSWWVEQLLRLGMTESLRSTLHRILAVCLIVLALSHVIYTLITRRGREELVSMIPRWRDVVELIHQIRFHLWRRTEHVRFSRYDYTQKAEYWALVWGTVIMALTGLVLWFPALAVGWFPSWIVQVSQTVHYYEAWLATLAIIIWHFFFTVFHPREYPMSWTWITGKNGRRPMPARTNAEWYEEQVSEDGPTPRLTPRRGVSKGRRFIDPATNSSRSPSTRVRPLSLRGPQNPGSSPWSGASADGAVMAVMWTMSLTVAVWSTTLTGCFIPRWIGPMTSRAKVLEQLVSDVSRVELGKDQDIGIAAYLRLREIVGSEVFVEGCAHLHLTIDN